MSNTEKVIVEITKHFTAPAQNHMHLPTPNAVSIQQKHLAGQHDQKKHASRYKGLGANKKWVEAKVFRGRKNVHKEMGEWWLSRGNKAIFDNIELTILVGKYGSLKKVPEEEKKFAIQNRKNVQNTFTKEEREGADAYSGKSYKDIQGVLRLGLDINKLTNPQIVRYIRGLDSLLSKGNVPTDVVAFRGIAVANTPLIKNFGNNTGKIVRDRGFCSTSLSQGMATLFQDTSEGVLCHILVPAGTPACYRREEHELILRRNSRFRVVAEDYIEGHKHTFMEVIP